MKVTCIGTAEYTVTSERDGETLYHVDLLALDGNGVCSCIDFGVRHQPLVTKEQAKSRCKHIDLAREHFCDDMLRRIAEEQKPKHPTRRLAYIE